MFRLYSFTSRSTVRRSQRTLQYLRPFHHTSKTRAKDDSLYSELLADLQVNPNRLTESVSKKRGSRTKATNSQRTKKTTKETRELDEALKTAKKPKRTKQEKPESPQDGSKEAQNAAAAFKFQSLPRLKMTPEQQQGGRDERKALRASASRQTPKALLQNPWIDVKRYLTAGYGGSVGRLPLGDNKRIHVTSETLCEDVLERLESSLEKHVGCDIIDINPGIGLWSSKLHDRLKPRTHILLEPDEKLYKPFLNRLLDAPNSKYRFVPNSGIVWGHLEPILSKEYLPHQEQYDPGDPRLEQPNDTLLVIANLGYHPRKTYRGFDSLATLVIHQFMSAMRSHSLFQRYGHVRIMVWASDEERRHILPMDIHQRRKSAVEAELSCENIIDIASSTREPGMYRRERYLDMEKGREVLGKMEAAGIKTPKGRESLLLKELSQERDKRNAVVGHGSAPVYYFSEELEKLEAAFAAGEFATYKDGNSVDELSKKAYIRGKLGKLVLTPEFKRLRYLRYRKKYKGQSEDQWGPIAEEFDAIISLQKEIHSWKTTGADTRDQEVELQERMETWKDGIQERFPEGEKLSQLLYMLDNRRTFSNNPPLLVWDRRDFEPLRVQPHEFFPKQEMCLLDFHPRSLWPILRNDLNNNYDILEFVLGTIFILPTQPIKKALNSLYPGAFEWIAAECPSLTDPSKGGALDLEMMTVRCMTEQMLEEIVEAWVRWPFRPNRYELLSRMGSASHESDELEISD